jgi:hypothetical protein
MSTHAVRIVKITRIGLPIVKQEITIIITGVGSKQTTQQ